MAKTYILAVDQSTSGTKALVVDASGAIAAKAAKEHKQHYPAPGWVEHDPLEIYENVKWTMREAVERAGISAGELAAVTITNQRETAVVWDAESGQPIHHAIVWQCQRTADLCERYREEGHEELVRELTGLKIDPYFSGTKFRWLLSHAAGARDGLAAGRLMAGTMDSWLVWKLTGGKVHATDLTNASRTLLFNIHTLQWDDRLLDLFGVRRGLLPAPLPSDGFFGFAEDVWPDAKVPITGVIGDSHAALFGQMCWQPGKAKATYGTGTSLMMNVGDRPAATGDGLVSTIAWGLRGRTVYALESVIRTSGDTIRWVRDQLGLFETYGELEQWMERTPSNDGVYLVPAFVGMGAPYWDPYARAAIVGMSRSAHKGHVMRAALESIAYQVRDAVELMQAESGIALEELYADGGASDNAALMQFQSDMLGRRVIRLGRSEYSALGSAMIGGIAVGFWDARDFRPFRPTERTVYSPRMDDGERERLYRGWKQAVAMVVHRRARTE